MKRPPLMMRVKVRGENGNFGIWLPFFLLIPVALVVLTILSPLILIVVIALWPSGWGKRVLVLLWVAIVSFYAMRGLKVDVQNPKESVYVSVV